MSYNRNDPTPSLHRLVGGIGVGLGLGTVALAFFVLSHPAGSAELATTTALIGLFSLVIGRSLIESFIAMTEPTGDMI